MLIREASVLLVACSAVCALWGQAGPVPAFDPNAMDTAVSPCVNFYQYACGTWLRNNPIPPDQSRWGRFNELQERNRETLRRILDQYSGNDPKRAPDEQKIGDFYAACMDESSIAREGTAPLKPALDRIAALHSKADLAGEIARLHEMGVNALFSFSAGPDDKDSTHNIAQADQGGLGLPDRDYYLKSDQKSADLRRQYQAHVARMFELLGDTAAKAAAEARVVMEIETALAKNSLDLVSRRDPEKVYHKVGRRELVASNPSFAWPAYLEGIHAPSFDSLNVAVPDFFGQLQPLLERVSLDHWKIYLTWHLVHAMAPMLPPAFVDEDFAFFGKTLRGTRELRPRWKRCVQYTDEALGEALGRKFVERTFGAEGKQRTLQMVHKIEAAMGEDIQQLPWMTEGTRKEALLKLHRITNKIGYPDRWRDYSRLPIVRGDAAGNWMRANAFEFQRQIGKIGQPVDRGEWFMSPPTVNAYYDPQMNNINFPAGILQPPFYDNKADDAVIFGGIGAVIGHELTHGFDDEGRHYDADGNLRDWWTAADAKAFEERAACFVKEYSAFSVDHDAHINGKLTLGENTADNGGVRLALMALLASLGERAENQIGGFTPRQRFFISFGQIWCENQTEQNLRLQVSVDPHSPGRERVIGVLRNMPEFRSTFGCRGSQPMVSTQACRVW